MDLGMPTLLELDTIEECARLCKELGLDFVELNMNMPQYQLQSLDRDILGGISEKYGIYFTLHLDENTNVSDFNRYVADAYIDTVKGAIDVAIALRIPIINMHLPKGVYFTLPQGKVYLFEKYEEKYLESILNFRKTVEKAIGENGIKLCVENSDGFAEFQLKALNILLESSVFALTYDIGHDFAAGGSDGKFIADNISRLRHMHIHDAVGRRDHLAIGDGEIDIEKYVARAKRNNARAVIETKTVAALRKSCERIRRFI